MNIHIQSPVVRAGDFVFTSGQWGSVDKEGRSIEGIDAQTRQSLDNMDNMLQTEGASLGDVVQLTILLKNTDHGSKSERLYQNYFPKNLPVHTVYVTNGISPREGIIETDCIAYCPANEGALAYKNVVSQIPGTNIDWKELGRSPVIEAGDFVFTTGRWGGVDKEGKPLEGIEAQTRQSLSNMEDLLRAVGASLSDVVKVNVLLENSSDWDQMEEVFRVYFPKDPPARTVRVISGTKYKQGALIGIDCIAYCPQDKNSYPNRAIISQIPGKRNSGFAESPVVMAGNFIFTSGRKGLLDEQRKRLEGIKAQTRQCLDNVKAMLQAARVALSDVVKTTIFLAKLEDFNEMEEVYKTYFPKDPPARTIFIDNGNHGKRKALIDIDCIAYYPSIKAGK